MVPVIFTANGSPPQWLSLASRLPKQGCQKTTTVLHREISAHAHPQYIRQRFPSKWMAYFQSIVMHFSNMSGELRCIPSWLYLPPFSSPSSPYNILLSWTFLAGRSRQPSCLGRNPAECLFVSPPGCGTQGNAGNPASATRDPRSALVCLPCLPRERKREREREKEREKDCLTLFFFFFNFICFLLLLFSSSGSVKSSCLINQLLNSQFSITTNNLLQ